MIRLINCFVLLKEKADDLKVNLMGDSAANITVLPKEEELDVTVLPKIKPEHRMLKYHPGQVALEELSQEKKRSLMIELMKDFARGIAFSLETSGACVEEYTGESIETKEDFIKEFIFRILEGEISSPYTSKKAERYFKSVEDCQHVFRYLQNEVYNDLFSVFPDFDQHIISFVDDQIQKDRSEFDDPEATKFEFTEYIKKIFKDLEQDG